jgi:uncharacterized protein YcfL
MSLPAGLQLLITLVGFVLVHFRSTPSIHVRHMQAVVLDIPYPCAAADASAMQSLVEA